MAVFVAVVRQGSMSRAARALAMSPSAVSQQVRQLELENGVSLLLRSTRKLSVTAIGERYYEACAAMVAAAECARAELATTRSAPSGELRIAIPAGFAVHAQQAFAELMAAYPALKLSLTVSDKRTDLIAARIDLAIAFATSLPDSDWTAKRLGSFDFWLCAAQSYVARRGWPTTPEELITHDWFWFAADNRPVHVELSRNGLAPIECIVIPRVVSDNQVALHNGCLAGMGIASLASLDASDHVTSGRLVRVLPEWTHRSYGIWALTPRRDAQPSKVKHAIAAMQDYLRHTPGVSS